MLILLLMVMHKRIKLFTVLKQVDYVFSSGYFFKFSVTKLSQHNVKNFYHIKHDTHIVGVCYRIAGRVICLEL